jgi:hypothetical protein
MTSFKLKDIKDTTDPIFATAEAELEASTATPEKKVEKAATLATFRAAFNDNVAALEAKVQENDPKEATKADKDAFLNQFKKDQATYVNTFKSEGTSSWGQVIADLGSKLLAALRTLFFPGMFVASYREATSSLFFSGAQTSVSAPVQESSNALKGIFEDATVLPVEDPAEDVTASASAGV